jgi:predicted Zn finger-like uncharacterized protein
MRLICPNCDAQYEVPPEAIPEQGRDVQCSACGHTWFEGGAEARVAVPASVAPGAEAAGAVPSGAEAATDSVERWEGAPVVAGDAEEEDDLADIDLAPEPIPDPEAFPSAPPRRSVSPEVAEILREEARREAEAREAEARARAGGAPLPPAGADSLWADDRRPDARVADDGPVEGREDGAPAFGTAVPEAPAEPSAPPAPAHLALDREQQRAEEARRRMARLRGEDAPHPSAVVPPATGTRRDRLPDIEEINSSLRASPPEGPAARAAPSDRRGFRLGFGGVLLIAALLALLYVYAPRIATALPWTAPVLRPYAAAVDAGRLWLDRRMQGLLQSMGTEPAAPLPAPGAPDPAPQVQAEPPAAPAPTPAGE